MVKSHYPRCLQCFPTQENLTTKTLNPKVTSLVIQVSLTSSSPSKSAQKHLYSSVQRSKIVSRFVKSWHGWCVRPKVRPTLSWKRAQQAENRVTFFQNVSRLETLQNMLSAQRNRVTVHKLCHDLEPSHIHNLKSINNTFNK